MLDELEQELSHRTMPRAERLARKISDKRKELEQAGGQDESPPTKEDIMADEVYYPNVRGDESFQQKTIKGAQKEEVQLSESAGSPKFSIFDPSDFEDSSEVIFSQLSDESISGDQTSLVEVDDVFQNFMNY